MDALMLGCFCGVGRSVLVQGVQEGLGRLDVGLCERLAVLATEVGHDLGSERSRFELEDARGHEVSVEGGEDVGVCVGL